MPGRAYVPQAIVPLTPEQLHAVTGQLTSSYAAAEQRLVALLSQGDITSWRRAFTEQQLSQVNAIMQTLGENTTAFARYWMPTLYDHGLSIADGYLMQPEWVEPYKALRAQGMSHMQAVGEINRLSGDVAPGGRSVAAHPGQVTPMDLRFTRLHDDAVAQLAENLVRPLGEARNYAAQRIEDMVARAKRLGNSPAAWIRQTNIREASLKAMQQAYLDGMTPKQAAKIFRQELKDRGITSFVDKAGRPWNMKRYTEMVTNTVCQECERAALTNRLMERGDEFVKITDHAEECDLCKPWEGKVLSLTGATEGYQTLNDALDAGLFHPNCSHAAVPYIPEIETARAEYRARQEAAQ